MNRGLKRPESVLVVIYTAGREVLLMDRVQPPGYWQSVTGSLHTGETPFAAAVREVREETGLEVEEALVDCGYSNRFEILPAWRSRYPATERWNTEYVYRVRLPRKVSITCNEREHAQAGWFSVAEALGKVGSRANREAIERYVC